MSKIARRERMAIIQALSVGAVPPCGLEHLRVGRDAELDALRQDLQNAGEGMASVRFVAGSAESGKTFFLQLVASEASARGFLVTQADLSLQHRFCSEEGEARALYTELMNNLQAPPGNESLALGSLLQRWFAQLEEKAGTGSTPSDVESALVRALEPLGGLARGFDFAAVLTRYYEGCATHNTEMQGNALRWLRAEYASVEEARTDLGVRSIIDDDALPEALLVFSAFVRIAGYAGLLVNLDELSVLVHRLHDRVCREANFAVIRHLLDACLQGRASGLVLLCAVDKSGLDDRQRGLKSDRVLSKRLASNRFTGNGQPDWASPVVRLHGVAREEYPELLANVQRVFAEGEAARCLLPHEGILEYLKTCDERFGPDYIQRPCETMMDFVGLLRVLEREPGADWAAVLARAKEAEARQREAGYDSYTNAGERVWEGGYGAGELHRVRHWSRRGLAAAIMVPLVLCATIVAIWAVVMTSPAALTGTLSVKFSDMRGGLRLDLTADALPRELGTYYSLEANLSEPCYVYLLTIDPTGRIDCVYGDENEARQIQSVQLPGGSELWPVTNPEGTRTVLLLASRIAYPQLEELQRLLHTMSPLPRAALRDLLTLTGGRVQVEHGTGELQAGVGLGGESVPGMLQELPGLLDEHFEVVEAVAFPTIRRPARSDPLLFDMND